MKRAQCNMRSPLTSHILESTPSRNAAVFQTSLNISACPSNEAGAVVESGVLFELRGMMAL
jgi:hypothetical protein